MWVTLNQTQHRHDGGLWLPSCSKSPLRCTIRVLPLLHCTSVTAKYKHPETPKLKGKKSQQNRRELLVWGYYTKNCLLGLLLVVTGSQKATAKEVLVPFLRWQVIGCEKVASGCIWGGLDWTIRKNFFMERMKKPLKQGLRQAAQGNDGVPNPGGI